MHNAGNMKTVFGFVLFFAGALFAQSSTNGVQTLPVDGYAARVNNTVITYGEVRESIAPYVQQLARQFQGDERTQRIAAAWVEGREAMIEEALLKAEAKSLGLTLPPAAIDDEVDRLIRERFDGDRALLTRALTQRRMTLDEWKTEVGEQMMLRVFYNQEVTRRASIPQQAVLDEYEANKEKFYRPFRVRYSHILINRGRTDTDRAAKKELAQTVIQKLRDGADFDAIAKEFSEGATTVSSWRELNSIPEEFHTALKELPVGGISGLIETSGEFYILRVAEREEAGYTPVDEARKAIENRLLQIERDRLHKELVDRLSKKHFVERY